MTNENENLEIKKKSQQVNEKDLKNVAGGNPADRCFNNQFTSCSKCY